MQNKKRLVRKVKKQCFVYWNMLKNLNKWRSKANYSASIIQSLSRQYLARAMYLEKIQAARLINRVIRGFLGKCELCRKKTLAYIKELIRRWHLAVPEWRRLRILREKRLLYRQVVKRRHARRASLRSVAPPSFDAILIGMNHHLVVEEAAASHGLNVQEILEIRNANKINDLDASHISHKLQKIARKKRRRERREALGSDWSSSGDDSGFSSDTSEGEDRVNFKRTNFKTSNWG